MSDASSLDTLLAWALVRVLEIEDHEGVGAALTALQEFYGLHAAEDSEGELRRAVIFHQAAILRGAGRLEEALAKLREVEIDASHGAYFSLYSHCAAQILDSLGDPLAALDELGRSVEATTGQAAALDLGPLELYADLASRLGIAVPPAIRARACELLRTAGSCRRAFRTDKCNSPRRSRRRSESA